ncbi:Snf7-domain-containing protein [Polychytrium aggregatum]|uniref:Snf7-domain-containing protein n=1 Tax=Polychytrium aggregatum TaxID=110093 RepID=UPI0022FEEF93|nr:Snf7-domain-containing protein [Polychytrium aggregatum]KAI9197388.1 Snf7-domain-containing protein [Polychytrium aggregatum]
MESVYLSDRQCRILPAGREAAIQMCIRAASFAPAETQDHLFQLKFTAKQLQRQSKKCQKDEATEKAKLKKAIQQGNMEGARIYAANAIRKKNESLNFLKLSSRIDGVASRVQTAVTMRKVTQSMAGVVKGMEKAMQTMNLEQISAVMDKFESQFEDLDVQTAYMDGAMSQTTAASMPQEQIDELMQQVADENGLELQMELPGAGKATLVGTATAEKEQDDLAERLARLRNPN